MTGKDVKALRKQIGLTQKKFGAVMGISHRTIEEWEQGDGSHKVEYAYELLISHAMVCPMIKRAFRVERLTLDGRSKRHFDKLLKDYKKLNP